MMKSIKNVGLILTLIIFILIGLTGCGANNNTESTNSNASSTTKKSMTAEEIINKMKNENSNIGKVVVYTEDNDLNNLLGRPGQYTSKVTFEDKRIEQFNEEEPTGGTIEVFDNESDMKKRKSYIESFSTSSMFSQYVYSKGSALLRIEGQLTPSQAKEYEEIFNKIME